MAMGVLGGTGQKLTQATIIVAGVASLVASVLSIVSIWLQTKNYRKPLLQRYVIRILLMVPIYSISSWCSIISLRVAMFVDPIRDVYEAFTIYTFFQLLINFLGGERALIIMMHGRKPVHHLWPLNHFLPNVDISDPHTFLAVKRGILQYAWLKPILGLAAIIMKSTGTYQEGYLGLSSGYLWSGIAYNISVTVSLYSLGMFWVCMSKDLQPFRPVPKFLCIKLIIFASYWQGFLLSILVWLGAIPDDVKDYTPDNLAAAIQDTLICIEMPMFAVAHWYAFSWKDYVDASVSAARMPVLYAIRDAFGIRDLIEDTKETFSGNKYEYRLFDSGDNVIAHEGSSSRVARMMEGMRYERGGKGKYWIPRPGTTSRTPLLGDRAGPSHVRNTLQSDNQYLYGNGDIEEAGLDPDEERLYETARSLKYGDYNYHVITAQEAPKWHIRNSDLLRTSSTRDSPDPTEDSAVRRANDMSVAAENVVRKGQSKHKKTSSRAKKRDGNSKGKQVERGVEQEQAPLIKGKLQHQHSGSGSTKSDPNQRVDLIVEDKDAEDRERDRARREGSASWNETPPKHRTYSKDAEENTQGGHKPTGEAAPIDPEGAGEDEFRVGDDDESGDDGHKAHDTEESREWNQARGADIVRQPKYGMAGEGFENVWDGEATEAQRYHD